ncbi:MAG: ornithine carbamoyltransferase [Elusimicrobia bacterium]|nr:ornithine carbamoyltransferase [Elusimicrobiota bacterium]
MKQKKRDLVSLFDLSAGDIWSLLKTAIRLKSGARTTDILHRKTLGLIFEKPSTRTTVSFAVAMHQLGGFPLILNAQNLQRKRGETIRDTALTLSRYLDAIMIRAFRHGDVVELARWATIPVINGLTDSEHPCQVLGDILTIMEHNNIRSVAALKKLKVVFSGDGNNMSQSWIVAASLLGFTFILACPEGYGPDAELLKQAQRKALSSGAKISITRDVVGAVADADAIYTDVWTSMGDEAEEGKRKKDFKPYQVNARLIAKAKRDCLIMHCLPAIRGEEVTADVLDGPQSVIFDQAENRLHIQKAVLLFLLKS